MICPLCWEQIGEGEELALGGIWVEGNYRRAHRECALRNVLGGIGHLRDHALWCIERKDPDAGLSFRESAKLVDGWVREHGFDSRE